MNVQTWEAGQAVSVWIKPTERCQLRCKHCFVNEDLLRRSPRWDLATFERVMRRFQEYFARHPVPGRQFQLHWHGGEPTLMGPEFYRAALPLAWRMLRDVGVTLSTTLQTNLLLIDERWIALLKQHFKGTVGTSFDWGLRHVDGSWERFRDRWLAKYRQCREAGLQVGVITVVNRSCIDIPDEVYDFFNDLGCTFETYPMAPWGEGNGKANIGEYGITAEQYGRWLLRIWTRFREDPEPRTQPVFLQRIARALQHGEPVGNHMAGDCAARNLIVSTDGTVSYCPALAGSREHIYGSLLETDLETLLKSRIRMLVFKRQTLLPEECRACRWRHVCRGGCPADALGFNGDVTTKDPYCETYLTIFPRIAHDIGTTVAPAAV